MKLSHHIISVIFLRPKSVEKKAFKSFHYFVLLSQKASFFTKNIEIGTDNAVHTKKILLRGGKPLLI